MTLARRVSDLAQRARSAAEALGAAISPVQRVWISRAFSAGFLALVFFMLWRELKDTDWAAVANALPTAPAFYLLFFLRFMLLPVTEASIYGAIWRKNLIGHFGAFLKKRVLNFSVGGQLGDAWFIFWAGPTFKLKKREIFSAVKDVTILSAAASNAVAAVMLVGFALFGDPSMMGAWGDDILLVITIVVGAGLALSAALIWFRGGLIKLSRRNIWIAFGGHAVRSILAVVLLAGQWSAGLPGVAFVAWFNLLIIELLVTRAPFIPGKDLLFLSLALTLAQSIDAPEAAVTALFLFNAALSQVVSGLSYVVGLLWRKDEAPAATKTSDGL
ncbi:MAG: hypothetical protein AAGC77_07235 [Pseudomonadota bacterium]